MFMLVLISWAGKGINVQVCNTHSIEYKGSNESGRWRQQSSCILHQGVTTFQEFKVC